MLEFPASLSEHCQKADVQGVVTLDARVGADGKVREFLDVTGNEELVAATKDAVSKWRFRSLRIDGTSQDMRLHVEVSFRLR